MVGRRPITNVHGCVGDVTVAESICDLGMLFVLCQERPLERFVSADLNRVSARLMSGPMGWY